MTAQHVATLEPALDAAAAREHAAARALTPSVIGDVGLELEYHLVDLRQHRKAPTWADVQGVLAGVGPLPAGSTITTEPGGQLELSSPPRGDVSAAIDALRADQAVLAAAAAQAGFGLVPIGADPVRNCRRISPAARYAAMERHFDALGCGIAGRRMMSATAALQVNVNAGPSIGWRERIAHLHRLGPVFVALSGCSPLVSGEASGWRSMRQQAWWGIDGSRTHPVPLRDDATDGWAEYALGAPVMLVRGSGEQVRAVSERISFADWASGASRLGQLPTAGDLDYHLSTLFPPIRPRGYLEIRCLDAVPLCWWPALAAIVVTLVDDPRAAGLAADACAPIEGRWVAAARDGLRERAMRTAVQRCVEVAAEHCPAPLRPQVDAYAELVGRGRTPGDDLQDVAEVRGPLAALTELIVAVDA